MIVLREDFGAFFVKVSRIISGEKVKVRASYSEVRTIVMDSGFYAFPCQNGVKVDDNAWLLSSQKPVIGVVAENRVDFENFIEKYCFTERDFENFVLISNASDTVGFRYDSVFSANESASDLLGFCKALVKPLFDAHA